MTSLFSLSVWSCAQARWSLHIGDPTMIGWAIAATYLLCAIIAFRVRTRVDFPQESIRLERAFWLLTGFLMLALALNKQLDLQTLLTAIGRCDAKTLGWYEQRRIFQREFIIWFGLAIILAGAFIGYVMRHTLRRNGLPLFGLVLIAGFALIRAIGFHHMDALLNQRFLGTKLIGILEISGQMLILLGGLRLLRRH